MLERVRHAVMDPDSLGDIRIITLYREVIDWASKVFELQPHHAPPHVSVSLLGAVVIQIPVCHHQIPSGAARTDSPGRPGLRDANCWLESDRGSNRVHVHHKSVRDRHPLITPTTRVTITI